MPSSSTCSPCRQPKLTCIPDLGFVNMALADSWRLRYHDSLGDAYGGSSAADLSRRMHLEALFVPVASSVGTVAASILLTILLI